MNLLNIFNQKTKTTDGSLDALANFFSALGDPTTLKILKILSKREMLCVTDVAKISETSISAVSHQMAKLKRLGMVKMERKGKMICYYPSDSLMIKVIEEEFLKHAD